MRKLLCAALLSLVIPVFAGTALALDRYNVVVPRDTKSFSVDQSSYVRLTGTGSAKATIEAEVVSGPARIANINDVFARKNGEPVADEVIKEFVFKHTGKGMVKVKLTVTPKEGTPKATTYEWEVK